MFTKLLIFSALIISCSTTPINGTVSEKDHVVKREAIGDYFPDWVPFKNKHGDELGEFVEVTKKSKVKKRLALPASFILKALVDDGEDFEGGAGESDSEDYYEKKDWSDVNRPDVKIEDKKATNHSAISDIDGVVNIITSKPEPIKVALESINRRNEEIKKERQKQLQGEVLEPEEDVNNSTEVSKQEEITERSKEEESSEEQPKEESTEKPKPSPQEVKENEERKAKILNSVDELKLRHAEEQRQIIFNDRHSNLGEQLFGNRESSESYEEKERRPERRSRKNKRKLTTKPDYDEYDDPKSSLEDKYKFNILRKTETPADESQEVETRTIRTTPIPTSPTKYYANREAGKLSVFRNPSLYVVYDDDEPTTQSVNAVTRGHKYSSKYSSRPTSTEDDKLVPVDAKDGEPTLFIPKKRKNRRKKIRTTTPSSGELDSSVAETVTDNYKQTTAFDLTAPDNTAPGKTTEADVTGTTGEATGTTGEALGTQPDAAATNSDTIADAVPASSDNKKEEHENYEHKKGGGREHHSEHSEEHEEHGKKAYEGHHEDTKTAAGHHDKENHLGKYDDHGGFNKHHSEEAGHYGDHHHEEKGKKHAQYEESGKHSKGHSTKGSHDIHKKEEYEKKVEFFEEDGDSGEEEKHGGYNHEKEHAEGGHFKHGKLNADHQHHAKGESGHFAKGGHGSSHKGHKQAAGHDSHGKHGQKHFQKGGREGGKKWIYHHGSPAKTANLVVIDRRGDQYYHGPHYYG